MAAEREAPRGDRRVLGRRPADGAALSRSTRCRGSCRAAEWARVEAGVEQRHRALNAFLADAYRAAGRRRGDADRAPGGRARRRAARSGRWRTAPAATRTPSGRPGRGSRAPALAATDVLRTAGGAWLVAKDHLRVPAGLGYALANRRQHARGRARAVLRRRRAGRSRGTPCRCCAPGSGAAASAGLRGDAADRRPQRAGRATTRGSSTACWPTPSASRWSARPISGRAWTAGSRSPSAASGTAGRRAVPPLRRRPAGRLPHADRPAAGRAAHRGRAGRPARPGQRAGQRARRRRRRLRLGAGDDPLLPGRGAAARLDPHLGAGRREPVGAGPRPAARARPAAGRRVRRPRRGRRPVVHGRPSWPRCRRRSRPRPTASSPRSRWRPRRRRPSSTARCSPGTWTCGCSRWPWAAAPCRRCRRR